MSINIVDALDSEKAAERIRAQGLIKSDSLVVDRSDKMLKEILAMPKDNSVDKSKLVAMELRTCKKQRVLQDIMDNEAARIKDRFLKESVLRDVGEMEENDPLRYMDEKGNVNLEWFVEKNNAVVKNEANAKGEDVDSSYSPYQACDYYQKEGGYERKNPGDQEKRYAKNPQDEGCRRDGRHTGNRSQSDKKDNYKKDDRRHSERDFRNRSYNRYIDDKENIHRQGPNDFPCDKRPVNKNRSSDSGSGNYYCRICCDDRYFAWCRDNRASETHRSYFNGRQSYASSESEQHKDQHRSSMRHDYSDNAKSYHKDLNRPAYNHHNDFRYQQKHFNTRHENPQHLNASRQNGGPYSLHQNSPDSSRTNDCAPSYSSNFESSHNNPHSTPSKPTSISNPSPISANTHINSSNFNETHGGSNKTNHSDRYQSHSVNLKIPGNLSDTFKNEKKDYWDNKSSSGAEVFYRNHRHSHSPSLPRVRANDKFYIVSKAYKRMKFEDSKDPSYGFKRPDDDQKFEDVKQRADHLSAEPPRCTKSKSHGRKKKRNSIRNAESNNPESLPLKPPPSEFPLKPSNPARTPLAELSTSRGLLETPTLPPPTPQTPHKLNLYN